MLDLTENDKKRLFAAIGHIVVRFQQMELWLAESLTTLIGLEPLNDRYAVMAAMSFRQKVDLLTTFYPRKSNKLSSIDIEIVRRAYYASEEFRNRIVHSVWAVCSEQSTWVREKGSLKGKSGFSKTKVLVDIQLIENAAESLRTIMEWEIVSPEQLAAALSQLKECEHIT